jgi:D-glycero-D-manno-heptose 1,7-bisphosphate phosphatase
MFLKAQKEFDIDMKHSVMIGDNERDIEAALKAGVRTNYLLSPTAISSKATQVIHSLGELL